MIPLVVSALAAPFVPVPVQGALFDAQGAPVEGTRSVVARLYPAPTGAAIHTESALVDVRAGAFGLMLGGASGLDVELIRQNPSLFLSIETDGAESERVPVGVVPRAAWAAGADVAVAAEALTEPYVAGTGLGLTGRTFSADGPWLDARYGFTSGGGLTLTGRSFSADEAWLSARYTHTAGAGLALNGRAFSADPAWLDGRYAFTNGAGLSLTARQFAVDTSWADARYQQVGAASAARKRFTMMGPTWTTTAGVTLGSPRSYDSNLGQMAFGPGFAARWTALATVPVFTSGQVPSGKLVRLDVSYAFPNCVNADCDPGLEIRDGAGGYCRHLSGDSSTMWYYSSVNAAEQSLSFLVPQPRDVRMEVLAGSTSTPIRVFGAAGVSGGASGNSLWNCPTALNPSTGITVHLVSDHTNEGYTFNHFDVVAEIMP